MTVEIRDVVFSQGQGAGAAVVSLGLLLADGRVAWGDCIDVGATSAETLITTIQRHIVPLLKGRKLTSFRESSAELDTLQETVFLSETVQPPAPEGLTRRNLFRVDFEEKLPEPIVNKWEEVRPISAAVRYGTSQALLHAFAMAQGMSPTQVICQAYSLRKPDRLVPIHAMLKPQQVKAAKRIFGYKVGTLGFAFDGRDPIVELGRKGEFAQRSVRHLKDAVQAVGAFGQYKPTFYLDLAGGYSVVSENNLGKVLGNLSGLDSAAKPYTVWAADPVDMGECDEQIAQMAELVTLLRMRGSIGTRIVARRYATSLDAVKQFLAAKAAHYLVLDPLELGGLHAVVDAFFACKQAGVGVIVGGHSAETALSAECTAQVALAIQPNTLLAKPASQVGIVTVGNAMRRALAELRHV